MQKNSSLNNIGVKLQLPISLSMIKNNFIEELLNCPLKETVYEKCRSFF